MYDPRVTFGDGAFMKNSDEFRKIIVEKIPKPIPDRDERVDIDIETIETRFTGGDPEQLIEDEITDYLFPKEYSVAGWA